MQATFFQNLKVVELANILAGPAVGMFFAELGAEVIKIENKLTAGDPTRNWKSTQEDPSSPYSAYYHSVNWNKQTVLLDLTQPADKDRVLQWIQQADVLITNYKAGSAEKIGMDYPTLSALNPQLIYGSISAFAENDPAPGFDAVIQALTGWMHLNGDPEGPPTKLPVALMDILAAHQLKQGILVALIHRMKTGKGSKVSVSLFDAAVASLANQASNWLNTGVNPQRMGSKHPNIAPYGDIFFSADNHAIILAVGTEQQFEQLCNCLEVSGLIDNPLFKTNKQRVNNREALIAALTPAFGRFKASYILERLQIHHVPAAPINDLEKVFQLPAAQKLILSEKLAEGIEGKCVKTVIFKVE